MTRGFKLGERLGESGGIFVSWFNVAQTLDVEQLMGLVLIM